MAADDPSAMQEVFHQNYSQVYQNIFRVVRQSELSKDLAQEVFIKMWNKRSSLQIRHTLRGYLSTMAYHEAIGYMRKKKNQLEVEIEEIPVQGDPYDGQYLAEESELKERIGRVLDSLPERCRAVFVLSRYEGKSYREISEILEISEKTVENQISKALSIFRNNLRDLLISLAILWQVLFF